MRIGFCGLLCLLFVTFKLLGVITWSWWVVFLPLYLPFMVLAAVAAVLVVLAVSIAVIEKGVDYVRHNRK